MAAKAGAQAKARTGTAFFARKHIVYVLIVVAYIFVGYVCSDYIGFDPIEAITDFPGGFVWFLVEFCPNAEAFSYSGKILSALFMTILDAVAAGTIGAVIAYILAVLGSRVSGFGGIVQLVIRAFATILRNIPPVAWGFILLYSFKQAEFTGFLALLFKSIGFLTRTFMETIDEVDTGSIEALKASGASRTSVITHGVVPLSLTQIVSWVLYMVETNFRDATLVGMLTGTGIGFVFNWYYRSFDYHTAGLAIICIAVTVLLIEAVSNYVRRRVDAQDSRQGPLKRRRSGAIKLRTRTKSNTVLALFFVFLVLVTVYTFSRMGYGAADIPDAARHFVRYVAIMFVEPDLVHYTAAEMIEGMLVTICIAVITIMGGVVIALVVSLFAASNLTNRYVSNVIKAVMAIGRAVPTIIWVLVFTVAIGLGPEAAVVGMMFHTVSFLTKAFSEAFEETDPGVFDALKATGATWVQRITRGVFPDKLNEIVSWSFIRFENNFVGAVTVGAIAGSGGIGYQLYMVANFMFDWHEVGLIIYMCLVISITLEFISSRLRKRFLVHR